MVKPTVDSAIRRTRQLGFSLLELLIVLVILVAVVGVVFRGVSKLQLNNTSQAVNLDLTQESRQFMDQVVQDLHHSGFPPPAMFDLATQAASPNSYASGLISISTTSLQYEGDVDGTGVSEVFVQLSPAAGPCPCSLRRGQVSKALWVGGTAPTYYTEVDGVMTVNVFIAYDFAGNTIALPCTPVGGAPAICADGTTPNKNIKDVGMLLNVRSGTQDSQTGAYTAITVSTEAKIGN